MQTEVPTLPIVYTEGDKHLTRKVKKGVIGVSPSESKNHTQCNNTTPFFVFNRKQLNPLLGGPYRDSMRVHCQSEPARMTATCKNLLGQRIISAKVLRMKELQNQLTDAHYHLNELANENRLLKALQKRQDSALKRYEGTNAELPRIINSHQEELKVLQTKYKQLKFQHKQTCDLLKEKESEIHSLQNQNKHLLKLSKDQHLGEREKLQIQVSDLNHEIQEQHKTIQMLNRKLTLENKKFKHQIHTEVTKHRETRKQLHISLEKLKKLEELLNNREKRLYSNPNSHQLPTFNRREPTTSQSLTNLRNNSTTTSLLKSSNNGQKSHADIRNETLPKLNTRELDDIGKLSLIRTTNVPDIVNTSETMTSLDHVRKFRLQKSARSLHTSPYASDEDESRDQLEVEIDSITDNCKTNQFCKTIGMENMCEDEVITHKVANGNLRGLVNFEQTNARNTDKDYRLPENIMRELGYSSSNSDLSDDDNHTNDIISPTCNSKYLHSRLINAAVNGIDTDSEKTHPIASKTLKKLDKSRIDKVDELNSPNSNRGKRDRRRDRIAADIHPDIASAELSNPEIDEISLNLSTTGRPNNDIQNDRINSRHNSISNSFHKFDSSNEDDNTNGKDLWTRLRGQLDQVQTNFTDPPQSTLDPLDVAVMKTSSSSNGKLSKMNNDTSDELLHYFDIGKNVNEFSKLSIIENDSGQSQMPIINGFNSNCKNDATVDDKDSPNLRENIPEVSDHEADRTDHSIEKENDENLTQKNNDQHPLTEQSDVVKARRCSSEQLDKNEQSGADTKPSNVIKQKLLAAMKAIDDNENVEFTTDKKIRETNNSIRSQVTENLYRGLPTHTKKRDDIIKDIFSDTKIDTKLHSGCSKLH